MYLPSAGPSFLIHLLVVIGAFVVAALVKARRVLLRNNA